MSGWWTSAHLYFYKSFCLLTRVAALKLKVTSSFLRTSQFLFIVDKKNPDVSTFMNLSEHVNFKSLKNTFLAPPDSSEKRFEPERSSRAHSVVLLLVVAEMNSKGLSSHLLQELQHPRSLRSAVFETSREFSDFSASSRRSEQNSKEIAIRTMKIIKRGSRS